jgi:hypothetical protein
MNLRCSPGDLAVLVRSARVENIGRVLRVVRWIGKRSDGVWVGDDWWEVDCGERPLISKFGVKHSCSRDSKLRPIRDSDGQDETLEWKSLPSPHKEMAE